MSLLISETGSKHLKKQPSYFCLDHINTNEKFQKKGPFEVLFYTILHLELWPYWTSQGQNVVSFEVFAQVPPCA